jgi:hypothetical protein
VLFAGVIIRQEQAFALGIHHHKGRRTLAVKSQCLVGQQAAFIWTTSVFLLVFCLFYGA